MVVVVGVTVMELLVPPFDQVYPLISAQPEAVKVAEPPAQIDTPPPVTVGAAGVGFTVMMALAEAGLVQLFDLQVTV